MASSFWKRPTRGKPKAIGAKVRYLFGRKPNPTKVAENLGVSPRTAREWLTGKRKPSKANAAKINQRIDAKYENAARAAAKEAEQPYFKNGGEGSAPGRMRLNGPIQMLGQSGSNYARPRSISQPMTDAQSTAALLAYALGDSDALYQVAREVMADYFNSGGGYNFEPTDLAFDLAAIDFE